MQIFRPEMLYNIFVMHCGKVFFLCYNCLSFSQRFHQLSSVLVVAVTNTAESWWRCYATER